MAITLFDPDEFNGVHAKMSQAKRLARPCQSKAGGMKLDVGDVNLKRLFAREADHHDRRLNMANETGPRCYPREVCLRKAGAGASRSQQVAHMWSGDDQNRVTVRKVCDLNV